MNKEQANQILIDLWLEKASDALASARLELAEGHLGFAINRLYYSCFYAVTALLLTSGKQFARHSAVLSEFNRAYVKTGKVDVAWSKFYQKLFDDRQESDYIPTATFEPADVMQWLQQAESFVAAIRHLINTRNQ
jgi:uncharacterized protein (UPF0332 family)